MDQHQPMDQQTINQLREKYINKIFYSQDDQYFQNQRDFGNKMMLIQKLYAQSEKPLKASFLDTDEVYFKNKEMENKMENKLATSFVNEATDIIERLLFDNETFYLYDFENLPFPVTRNINYYENVLHRLILEGVINNNHISILEKQIDNIQQKIEEALIQKKIALREKEILELGFPRTEITNDIKILIKECWDVTNIDAKIACAREIYRILSKPYSKKFINYHDNKKFKNVIMDKLFEFRDTNNLKEARVWWRNVFGTRMPVTRIPITK